MSRGVNMVVLVGNVGQDPEVRYSANGSAIVNMSIATSSGWRDKQNMWQAWSEKRAQGGRKTQPPLRLVAPAAPAGRAEL